MKNLLNNKGTNNKGAKNAPTTEGMVQQPSLTPEQELALLQAQFEQVCNSTVLIEEKVPEGTYEGVVADIIKTEKENICYYKLVVKSGVRNITHMVFDTKNALLEAKVNGINVDSIEDLLGKTVKVTVYYVHNNRKTTLNPILPVGIHDAKFSGISTIPSDFTFVISYVVDGKKYNDIKCLKLDGQQQILSSIKSLGLAVGIADHSEINFLELNQHIGADFKISVEEPAQYKSRFNNYKKMSYTAEAEAAATLIPKF